MSHPGTRSTRRSTAVNSLAALNAVNAWSALDRHGPASIPLFGAGLPTSEFPLPMLAAHLMANAVATRSGAFRGKLGVANGVLAAATGSALLALERSARKSGEVYETALVGSLGADYRDRIAHPSFPAPGTAVPRTPGAIRTATIHRQFTRDRDLSYGPAGRANQLDIWRRYDLPSEGRAPVLIQIPGGAWTMGDKHGQAHPLMSHLAARGWICVAINYRLSPRNSWPDHIVDVKRAIAWVRENIAHFGGDPDFLAVSGGSAGGHLSALAALTPHITAWQPGFEQANTSVRAAVPFYGAYDWTNKGGLGHSGLVPHLEKSVVKATLADAPETFGQASPASHCHTEAPPFLISHGRNDSLIPVEQARHFARRLALASSSKVVYAELPHAQHAFEVLGSRRATAAASAVGRFLGVVYGDYLRARA